MRKEDEVTFKGHRNYENKNKEKASLSEFYSQVFSNNTMSL